MGFGGCEVSEMAGGLVGEWKPKKNHPSVAEGSLCALYSTHNKQRDPLKTDRQSEIRTHKWQWSTLPHWFSCSVQLRPAKRQKDFWSFVKQVKLLECQESNLRSISKHISSPYTQHGPLPTSRKRRRKIRLLTNGVYGRSLFVLGD